MSNWHSLSVEIEPAAAEAIEFALNELGALGTEINNLGPDAVAAATINVVGYFEELPAPADIEAQISYALEIYSLAPTMVKATSVAEVGKQDWLAEWKKHWKPTVTDRFIIAPPWDVPEDPTRIVMKIEPSMAFGTGTHETTRLCLAAIERFYDDEMSFLDVGTGTGILAIAAAMLRAGRGDARFFGCDTDADSIAIARENAALNGVPEIEFEVGPISDATPVFDFVCANLTADVIIPILPLLTKLFNHRLVLSGILATQEESVTETLADCGVTKWSVEKDGEWISVVC